MTASLPLRISRVKDSLLLAKDRHNSATPLPSLSENSPVGSNSPGKPSPSIIRSASGSLQIPLKSFYGDSNHSLTSPVTSRYPPPPISRRRSLVEDSPSRRLSASSAVAGSLSELGGVFGGAESPGRIYPSPPVPLVHTPQPKSPHFSAPRGVGGNTGNLLALLAGEVASIAGSPAGISTEIRRRSGGGGGFEGVLADNQNRRKSVVPPSELPSISVSKMREKFSGGLARAEVRIGGRMSSGGSVKVSEAARFLSPPRKRLSDDNRTPLTFSDVAAYPSEFTPVSQTDRVDGKTLIEEIDKFEPKKDTAIQTEPVVEPVEDLPIDSDLDQSSDDLEIPSRKIRKINSFGMTVRSKKFTDSEGTEESIVSQEQSVNQSASSQSASNQSAGSRKVRKSEKNSKPNKKQRKKKKSVIQN